MKERLAGMLLAWFDREELGTWVDASWTFAKQILPLLLGGVLFAGLLRSGMGSRPALALILAGPAL